MSTFASAVEVNNPGNFILHLSSRKHILIDMHCRLNSLYQESRAILTDIQVDRECVAKYSEDREWYRGVVSKIYQNDEILVHFVDYGNNQKCKKNYVFELSEFANVEPFAFYCFLDGFRPTKTWTDDDCSLFNSVVPEEDFHVVFWPIENCKFPVKMYDNGQIINVKLGMPKYRNVGPPILDGFPCIAPKEADTYTVLAFSSPERFFIQPKSAEEYKDKLEDIQGFYSSLKSEELSETVEYPNFNYVVEIDHGDFRRALATRLASESQASVFLVDSGESATVDLKRIRRIVPEFMEFPALVWTCKLGGVVENLNDCWTKAIAYSKIIQKGTDVKVTLISIERDVRVFDVELNVIPSRIQHLVSTGFVRNNS